MVSALLLGIVAILIAVANSGPGSIAQQNATVMFGAIGIISIVAAVVLFIKSKNE